MEILEMGNIPKYIGTCQECNTVLTANRGELDDKDYFNNKKVLLGQCPLCGYKRVVFTKEQLK